MMDIYIVTYGTVIVGASAKLQGAENIRADKAREYAAGPDGRVSAEDYDGAYDRFRIVNTELRDTDTRMPIVATGARITRRWCRHIASWGRADA